MQDFSVPVSSSNTGEIDTDLIVSQLNKIKELPNFEWAYSHKVHYLNIPASFDIETSSFYDGLAKKAIMYIWTLNIDGITFIGRTWNQFVDLLNLISKEFELVKFNRRLLIYIHNLEYEFQFMRKWLDWYDVFADDKRQPLYAVTQGGIEFRCSYRLSGYSLAKLSDELQTYKTSKMVGDLDYSLLRTSITPMTPKEMKYATQDTKVVVCYIQEEIEKNGDISKIPYTKTGYVRRYCQNQCLALSATDDVSRLKGLKYRDIIQSLTLTYDQYKMCKDGFQGGFTHANVNYVNKTLSSVGSWDFTSSYPYTMVSDYFPMSSPKEIVVDNLKDFIYNITTHCCLFQIRFNNIRPKTTNENPISSSRCNYLKGEHLNNGRVINAEVLETTITELDFDIIQMFYVWDSFQLGKFLIFYRGYLPTPLVKSIISLYKDKTKLKGVKDKEAEYLNSKGMLNSSYGMAVTDIVRDSIEYHQEMMADEWQENSENCVSQLTQYNKNKARFLYYPWGVWVTAHARHNLFEGIYAFGDDYVYSDTDSIKAINMDKHKDFIESYNLKVRKKLERAASYHNIPMEDFEPETIKGVKKLIGVWDFEGTYDRFKTLGAKRYLVEKNGDIEFTVAGVNKKALKSYMLETYGVDGSFEHFTRMLDIPPEHTGKLTHTYIDKEWEGDVIDYLGRPFHYYEKSSIHLEKASFKISMIDEFWDYVTGVQQKEK